MLFKPERTVATELWVYNNFPGHLFRRTVTPNLFDDGPDRSNLPLVDTFTSLLVFPG